MPVSVHMADDDPMIEKRTKLCLSWEGKKKKRMGANIKTRQISSSPVTGSLRGITLTQQK